MSRKTPAKTHQHTARQQFQTSVLMLLAGLLGLSGVTLAAVGSHLAAGAVVDDPAAFRAWQAASLLHLVHAPAVLAIGLAADRFPAAGWRWSAYLMFLGVLLFCGSIYYAGLQSPRGAATLAPIGGSMLILSWGLVAVSAWRSRR